MSHHPVVTIVGKGKREDEIDKSHREDKDESQFEILRRVDEYPLRKKVERFPEFPEFPEFQGFPEFF